jgi:Phosphoinositide phospholipase C, Ca2+-dependent
MSHWDTPYNRLTFKASHNSYESPYSMHQLLSWDQTQPYKFGCRGLEIDFTRHSDDSLGRSIGYFQVTHKQGGSGLPLAYYLGQFLSYHLNHPQHDPIFITLCIKSQDGSIEPFPQEMDNYLRTWFYEPAIFRPKKMLVKGMDLFRSVEANGWPSGGEIRNHFFLCLSGTEAWKAFYADSDIEQRLCFADIDFPDDQPNPAFFRSGNRIIANMNVFTDDFPYWKIAVTELHRAGMLVRGYRVNSHELWGKSLVAHLNVIATDDVESKWANVGSEPFEPI